MQLNWCYNVFSNRFCQQPLPQPPFAYTNQRQDVMRDFKFLGEERLLQADKKLSAKEAFIHQHIPTGLLCGYCTFRLCKTCVECENGVFYHTACLKIWPYFGMEPPALCSDQSDAQALEWQANRYLKGKERRCEKLMVCRVIGRPVCFLRNAAFGSLSSLFPASAEHIRQKSADAIVSSPLLLPQTYTGL